MSYGFSKGGLLRAKARDKMRLRIKLQALLDSGMQVWDAAEAAGTSTSMIYRMGLKSKANPRSMKKAKPAMIINAPVEKMFNFLKENPRTDFKRLREAVGVSEDDLSDMLAVTMLDWRRVRWDQTGYSLIGS
jgi:hypothetical protein